MTTKHTPGPWVLEDRGCKFIVSKPGDGYITRDVCRMDSSTMSAVLQQANARLIAAAPDLLEALLTCKNAFAGTRFKSQVFDEDKVAAAIAKATGETQ